MLDLEPIRFRWTMWHDYEESSSTEMMLSDDIPALIAEVERLNTPQPCGHPGAAIRSSGHGPGETTNWCGWCADIARAVDKGAGC